MEERIGLEAGRRGGYTGSSGPWLLSGLERSAYVSSEGAGDNAMYWVDTSGWRFERESRDVSVECE